jgi:amidohydrolase
VTAAIASLTTAREHELVAFRRRLHAHPELSYAEHATTQAIAERLQVAGLHPRVLEIGTGLVCDVPGNAPGPLVVLRADIDALAMPDGTETEYRSRREGVAHACGHDAHTAVVLGAGLVLRALTEIESIPGTVRLVFEPGEESVPGGAVEIVREGWITGASYVLGLHCDPKVDLGQIGLRVGAMTAASDTAEIVISGPGGHTARPQLTVDLIEVIGRFTTDFPREVRRRLGAPEGPPGHGDDEVVVVFGAVHAGDAANVIPAHGTLRCSVRCADRATWDRAEEVVRSVAAELLRDTGATHTIDYRRGTPPVVNDPAAIAVLDAAARSVVGDAGVLEAPRSMGADTFAWYGEHARSAYARLGTHSGDRPRRDLHASTFDIDERAIAIGTRFLAEAALTALRGPQDASDG